jgi:hypothetical protein
VIHTVIPAIQEAGIRRIKVRDQSRQKKKKKRERERDPISKYSTQKGIVKWLKW